MGTLMRFRGIGRPALLLAALATIVCDQVTKQIASTTLAGRPPLSYLGDTIRVVYAENQGGFLGLGAGLAPGLRAAIFTVGTGVMLLILIVVAMRRRVTGWPALGLVLFAAGGASNWFDRATGAAVVDFLNVGIGPLRTGVFNVADMAIMAGAAIFVLAEFRRGRENGKVNRQSGSTPTPADP